MSSAGGGPAAAVSKSGKCKCEVVIGPTTHVIMHSWRAKTNRKLELITTLVDSQHKNWPSNLERDEYFYDRPPPEPSTA